MFSGLAADFFNKSMATFRGLSYKGYLANSSATIPRETKRRRKRTGESHNQRVSDDEVEHTKSSEPGGIMDMEVLYMFIQMFTLLSFNW